MSKRETEAFARNLRAAMAYRGLVVADLADKIPPEYRISRSTLERIVQGKRPPNDWEYALLADLLEVPEWFMRAGFAGVPAPSRDELEQRDQSDRRYDEIMSSLRTMSEQMNALMAAQVDVRSE